LCRVRLAIICLVGITVCFFAIIPSLNANGLRVGVSPLLNFIRSHSLLAVADAPPQQADCSLLSAFDVPNSSPHIPDRISVNLAWAIDCGGGTARASNQLRRPPPEWAANADSVNGYHLNFSSAASVRLLLSGQVWLNYSSVFLQSPAHFLNDKLLQSAEQM